MSANNTVKCRYSLSDNIKFLNKRISYNNTIIKRKKVEVIYNRREETHDGYCSDPYDCDEFEDDIIIDYDLPSDNSPFVAPEKELYEQCCNGSGYCGMGTTYTIKNVNYLDLETPRKCSYIRDGERCTVNTFREGRCQKHLNSYPKIKRCVKCNKTIFIKINNSMDTSYCGKC